MRGILIVLMFDEWRTTFLRNGIFLLCFELKDTSSGASPHRSMDAATRSLCIVSLSRDDRSGGEAIIVLRQRRHTWVVKMRSLSEVRKDGIRARISGGRRLIAGKVFIKAWIVESARLASSCMSRSWECDIRDKSERNGWNWDVHRSSPRSTVPSVQTAPHSTYVAAA
jgi:hypothetical protein